MLEEVLDYIHNFFEKEIMTGRFSIVGGSVDGLELLDGQYFRIRGSVLNDGVYQYPTGDGDLTDEDFDGEIWAMAVPPAVIALSEEITAWISKYGSSELSPYSSESFGGYSYTKANGGANGSSSAGWRDVFRSKLNRWRKLA